MQYCLTLNKFDSSCRWWSLPVELQTQVSSGTVDDFIRAVQSVSPDEEVAPKITVLVPGEQVTLHHAQVPTNLRHSRLRQAIPFALESQIHSEIDAQHFAIATQMHDKTWPVAVVAQAQMHAWLVPLQDAGLVIDAVLPDYFAVPFLEDAWHIVLDGDRALCRTGLLNGFTIASNLLNEFLKCHLAQSSPKPQRIMLSGADAAVIVPESSWPFDVALVCNDQPASLPVLLASGLAASPQRLLNLCQGQFVQAKLRQSWSILPTAAIALFGLCAIAWLGGWAAQSIYFRGQIMSLEAEIKTVYKKAYPQAARVTSPRSRIEKELKALGAEAHSDALLPLLARIGEHSLTELEIEKLDYKQQRCQLQIKVQTFAMLDQLISAWQQAGLTVKRERANSIADGVSATVSLSLTTATEGGA